MHMVAINIYYKKAQQKDGHTTIYQKDHFHTKLFIQDIFHFIIKSNKVIEKYRLKNEKQYLVGLLFKFKYAINHNAYL